MKFTISLLLFMRAWFPVFVFGLPATFVMLDLDYIPLELDR